MKRAAIRVIRHIRRGIVNIEYTMTKPKLPTTPPVSTIWIVRHGEREDVVDRQWFEKEQRAYDDPPLAELGRVQVGRTTVP